VPSWEEPPEGDSRIALRIDPGMAFGTGTHESTRMAVELIEGVRLAEPILDLGTGSGILAIAASRLGAKRVMASDLDRDAVRVAQANFRKNRVEVPVFEGSTDAVRTSSIGLLLGNLTAEVIESRLGEFARILVPGGTVVLSGILASQAGALEAALAASGFRVDRRIEGGEWVAYVASRAGRRGD
jgi:ribosomal protein L11 methyltransferase